jgi:uncharacterized small protein (DUF1192 family)
MNDDEDVLGIDLDAWQPPPPPNVADGVIARMRSETTSVTAQALPVETPAPKRRWWLAGAAAAAIATTTVVTFVLTRGPANTRGVSAGDRAAHIAIGPTTADIDPNTAVSWRRDGDRIAVKQAGGAAAWRVDEDDTLTIETGLASIQATNASLRVEVKMLDDKQTIALSALTAAAVAAVTIVVYEGAVKTNGVTVAPGTTYQITGKGEHVIEDEITVGAADLNARIAALEAELAKAKAELDAATGRPPADFDRDTIQLTMRGLASRLKACANGYVGTLQLTVRVKSDGSVAAVEAADVPPRACVAAIVRDATFPATTRGGTFTYPLVFAVTNDDLRDNPFAKKTAKCDPDALKDRGQEMFSIGRPAEALVLFEQLHACEPTPTTFKLVMAAACKSQNLAKARVYWKQMNQSSRNAIQTLCHGYGFSPEDLDGADATMGRLLVTNATPARVFLDGLDMGTTPLSSAVTPGKHKVTFVVGEDKYTFSVLVKAGETTRLEKELP